MNSRTLILFVTLFLNVFYGRSQGDSFLEVKIISINDSSILSFCDSIIIYSNECFENPMWYKVSINFESDTFHLWGTAVQFMDSQYYVNNQYWLRNSIFLFDSNAIGVFVYSDKIFEIVSANVSERTLSLTNSTMRIPLYLSNASPVFLSKDIMFPHYYQCLGLISINDKKIKVTKKICTCNDLREKAKLKKSQKRHFKKLRQKLIQY